MRIQHNIPSMNAYRNFTNNSKSINKNLEKLSSGYKINRAGDDAAGLAISEKMRAQVSGLEVAQKNAKDGISLIQTAEGALTEVHDMLNRMYKLAEQSANGTYDATVDRQQLQKEVESLRTEIDRIADSANFNGIKLLNGDRSVTAGGGGIDGEIDTTNSDWTNGASWGGFEWADDLDSTLQETIAAELENGTIGFEADGEGGFSVSITAGDENATMTYAIADIEEGGSNLNLTLTTTVDSETVTVGTLTVTLPEYDEDSADDYDGTVVFSLSAKAGGSGSGGPMKLQVGDTSDAYNQMSVSIDSIRSSSLGYYKTTAAVTNEDGSVTPSYKELLDVGEENDAGDAPKTTTDADGNEVVLTIANIDISDQSGAADAMDVIKQAINYVSDTRGGLGALQNRLEHTINNLSVMQENIQDAESTIRDTDVAEEMMKYTKNNILVQSAQAMLAQANQLPQGVLQLLQ